MLLIIIYLDGHLNEFFETKITPTSPYFTIQSTHSFIFNPVTHKRPPYLFLKIFLGIQQLALKKEVVIREFSRSN